MKFRNLRNWSNPDECKSLIYFAQLMDEMLFTYTLDTYKPSVINTPTIGVECLETIRDVEAGIINEKNVEHLTAELINNLKNDDVAKEILGSAYQSFCNKLKNPKISPKERRSITEIIVVQLSPKAYKEESERLIYNEITSLQWSTEKIRKLTRNYVSLLIYIGYSQSSLRNKVTDFFYRNPNQITKNIEVRDFFDCVKLETKKYSVHFKVGGIFLETEPTFKNLKLSISPTPSEKIKDHDFFKQLKGKLVLTAHDIQALDHFSARERAEKLLSLAASFLNLFHHKENPTWSNEALVVESETIHRVSGRLNPMTKGRDMRPEKARRKIALLMSDFDMANQSFSKFLKSAELHSMALKSESIENQLLNLWTSLESLVPNEARSKDEATIEHIANKIIPFLNISYIDGLIENLLKDLIRWDRVIISKHLIGITGNYKVRLAKLLILQEYEGARISLEAKFKDYTLLQDRFNHIKKTISSPQKIKETLDNHTKRLEWQFRRIYRTRNNIVHSGKNPIFTHLLVEHTHNYLDIILDHLVFLASKPRKIRTVSQGFKYIEVLYNSRYETITKADLVFSEDTIVNNLLWRN